ncbi:MAG: formate dehydrogenase accessory sulfurtransferase FdhD [Ilumatobacteraceae bacterium]
MRARRRGVRCRRQRLDHPRGRRSAQRCRQGDRRTPPCRSGCRSGCRPDAARDAGQDAGDGPTSGLGLFVSGRASIEMVQKAWAGGFTTVLAVSAPTTLAVRAARRAGIMLAGFVRDDSLNVYSQPPRRRTPVA